MAWGNFILDKGYLPQSVAPRFRAVKAGTVVETVTAITANTDNIVGVVQFDISAADITRGKDASVRMMGVTEMEAVGAIPYGSWVTLEADGRASALVAASGKSVIGKCVGSPAVNAADRIAMLIVHTITKA